MGCQQAGLHLHSLQGGRMLDAHFSSHSLQGGFCGGMVAAQQAANDHLV